MVYNFDPKYVNGTIFEFAEWDMLGDFGECYRANKPIPASYFPQSLTVAKATKALPDMIRASRSLIVFSERARTLLEQQAPGQVEFIPVSIHAESKIASRLKLDDAYYFINVLGRAQRLLWLEMPIRIFPTSEDGVQRVLPANDYSQWKLRQRAADEPLIWHEDCWHFDKKQYRASTHILVEDALWQELNTCLPYQLNAQRVGADII